MFGANKRIETNCLKNVNSILQLDSIIVRKVFQIIPFVNEKRFGLAKIRLVKRISKSRMKFLKRKELIPLVKQKELHISKNSLKSAKSSLLSNLAVAKRFVKISERFKREL